MLNSLSGELLHTSWRCVAPGATFIELGKRNAAARCKLAMDPLDDNRAFIGIEMARLAVLDGAEIGQLLDRIVYLYRGRVLTLITPSRAFPCKEIQKAFQCFAKGTHIGKIVVENRRRGTSRHGPCRRRNVENNGNRVAGGRGA